MDYIDYITDINITNKFLYLGIPKKLSKFRITRFGISFHVDSRMHNAAFYGTRVLIDQVLCKRFHATKMRRYVLSSTIRFNQVVGASSTVSGAEASVSVYVFLQYSLIRLSYGLVYVGPEDFKTSSNYLFKTGFNRILFLFNLGADSKTLMSIYETLFYGFDISVDFSTISIYTNKVILSHYGYPLL